MTTPLPNDGATPDPETEKGLAECMGRFKHNKQWIWEGSRMTEKAQCSTCGEISEPRLLKNQD